MAIADRFIGLQRAVERVPGVVGDEDRTNFAAEAIDEMAKAALDDAHVVDGDIKFVLSAFTAAGLSLSRYRLAGASRSRE